MSFLRPMALSLTSLLSLSTPLWAADALPTARDWIEQASGRDGIWRDHGVINFPSQQIFVGDPTWGDDYHIRDPRRVPAKQAQLYSFGKTRKGQNYLIWIEFSGQMPVTKGKTLNFGVDAATLGLGDLEAGQALVDLGSRHIDAGKGDSFDFLMPHIQASQHFAKWLDIPAGTTTGTPTAPPSEGDRIFLATTGRDGGLSAVWVQDQNAQLSGILIDIAGRAEDRKYIDTLLPQG